MLFVWTDSFFLFGVITRNTKSMHSKVDIVCVRIEFVLYDNSVDFYVHFILPELDV